MKTILVVDDHAVVRKLVQVTFDMDPYRVLETDNGSDALEMARQHRPDVILLDISLPGGPDGLEVCRRLKADEATRNSIIIMLSARTFKHEIEAGYAAGADDYVVKPFSPDALIAKVSALLG